MIHTWLCLNPNSIFPYSLPLAQCLENRCLVKQKKAGKSQHAGISINMSSFSMPFPPCCPFSLEGLPLSLWQLKYYAIHLSLAAIIFFFFLLQGPSKLISLLLVFLIFLFRSLSKHTLLIYLTTSVPFDPREE